MCPTGTDYPAILNRYLELDRQMFSWVAGLDQFLPKGRPGSRRTDDTDMIAVFDQSIGYQSRQQFAGTGKRAGAGKVLGLFSLSDMSFEIDRDKQN